MDTVVRLLRNSLQPISNNEDEQPDIRIAMTLFVIAMTGLYFLLRSEGFRIPEPHPEDKKRWDQRVEKYKAHIEGKDTEELDKDDTFVDPVQLCEHLEKYVGTGARVILLGEALDEAARSVSAKIGTEGLAIGITSEAAVAKKTIEGCSNFTYRLGTEQHLPVRDAFADVILLYGTLQRDLTRYSDVMRVLKHGGRVAFPVLLFLNEQDALVYGQGTSKRLNIVLEKSEIPNILDPTGLHVDPNTLDVKVRRKNILTLPDGIQVAFTIASVRKKVAESS